MAEIEVDEEALIALAYSWFNDPVTFCQEAFPPTEWPRECQPEVMASVAECPWTAVAGSRGIGKTRLAAFLTLWFLVTRILLYPTQATLVYFLSPTWDLVCDPAFAEIAALWERSILPSLFPSWRVLKDRIDTGNPLCRAMGIASNKQDNLEGRHAANVLVIIDEAKTVPSEFFNSILGMLGSNGKPETNRVIAIGTPGKPAGWFYEAFTKNRAQWKTFQVRGDKYDRTRPGFELAKALMGQDDPYFRQQYCGEFTGADEGSVIGLPSIERAAAKHRNWKEHFKPDKTWKRVMALDPAARGDDESVLSFRHGPILLSQEAWKGKDEMWSAHHVVERAKEFCPDIIVIDEVGIGAGIRSRVYQLCGKVYSVRGWNSGRSAVNKAQYANKKSEAVFALKKLFEDGAIVIPDDSILIGQLTGWTWDYSESGGKTKVIDPADSPDRADSALMAFFAERLGMGLRAVHMRLR